MGDQRFFFMHLVKTAGTTLRKRLEHHFGPAAVYPDASDDDQLAYFSIAHLRKRMQARGDEIRVVAGHFPLCTTEILGGGFTTLTVLRDPVDRIVSHLRHHREWTPEARGKTLEEVYADPVVFNGIVHNHTVKMLSLTAEEAFSPTPAPVRRDAEGRVVGPLRTAGMLTYVDLTPERLERAEANLASMDVFGLHERIDELFDELERRFGWDLGHEQHEMRRKPDPESEDAAEVSNAFRARLAEDNAMDVELYRFARDLYERR